MLRGVAAVAAAVAIGCGVGGCDSALPPVPSTSGAVPAASGSPPTDLTARIAAARDAAAARGADVTLALLDRATGRRYGAAETDTIETASVAKLFIADAVLRGGEVSDSDRELLARMLERSDDDAANELWNARGGDALIDDVADRYGLGATTAPWDGNWWNTETTADDLADWYAGLLDGRGGLDPDAADAILGHLRAAGPYAADGYDQRFGVRDALPAQPVDEIAAKQGWMCCSAGRWVHLSTAVVGPDARYVVIVTSREIVDYGDADDHWAVRRLDGDDPGTDTVIDPGPRLPDTSVDSAADDASAVHARRTVTDVVRILFPEGRIG